MSTPAPKKFKIRYDRIIAAAAIFILIIILIASAINKASNKNSSKNNKPNNASLSSSLSSSSTTEELTDNTVIKVTKTVDDIHAGNLVLINSTYKYASTQPSAAVSIKENKKSSHYYYVDDTISLNPDALSALDSMMDDYYNANQSEDIRILDAYRSSNSSDTTSELSTGLSFNIGLYLGNATYSPYTPTDKYAWVTNNCQNYGFIERYREDKKDITGVAADVSHFRFVGVPHAYYMTQNNLSLEEYITLVKDYDYIKKRLDIDVNDKKYQVYYVAANTAGNTEIYIDPGKTYDISGNNVDGFIVTVEV